MIGRGIQQGDVPDWIRPLLAEARELFAHPMPRATMAAIAANHIYELPQQVAAQALIAGVRKAVSEAGGEFAPEEIAARLRHLADHVEAGTWPAGRAAFPADEMESLLLEHEDTPAARDRLIRARGGGTRHALNTRLSRYRKQRHKRV